VTTAGGAQGVAICTAGISVGSHEIEFAYDGGTKWRGKGVMRAVNAVNELIAPALKGMDTAQQQAVDQAMLDLGKLKVGGNATAAVSAAALKAGAAALDIPLYQHIGGANACTLPVPGVICLVGSDRYGSGARSGGKPSYAFMCYGFKTFSEASYAGWDISVEWSDVLNKKLGIPKHSVAHAPGVARGEVNDDREIWDLMVQTINKLGYEGKIGIQVDVASETYWEEDQARYIGLFSETPKTQDDLFKRYHMMATEYPFVNLEDPFDEDDYESHAILTRELDIQIVGDDLFTTDPVRVQKGIDAGAANCVLLKVNQIGTISEALDMIQLAYRNGYGVMPCSSRGEGADIADYCVGINAGTVREGATGPTGNRFLQIEAELGKRAKFLGAKGFKGRRFQK
jgi:enolase